MSMKPFLFTHFFLKTLKVFYVLDIYAILFLKKNFIAKYIKDDSASNIYSFSPDLVDLRKTQYFQAFATYGRNVKFHTKT